MRKAGGAAYQEPPRAMRNLTRNLTRDLCQLLTCDLVDHSAVFLLQALLHKSLHVHRQLLTSSLVI